MKKKMFILTGIFFVIFLPCLILYFVFNRSFLLSLSITFGTILYHFLMRLLVGFFIDGIFHNKINYRLKIFSPRPFEKKLYKFLRVKKWKAFMPTFDPDTFDISKHPLEELVMASCQAEVVHTAICVLSFLPILGTVFFGSFLVFLLTSIFAFLIDLCFVIMQRFNRPRLISAIKFKEKSTKKQQITDL